MSLLRQTCDSSRIFGARHPSQNTNTFVACAKDSTPDVQNEPKGQTGKAKVPESGIGEAPGFGLRILLEARKPGVSDNRLVHCIQPESGVRYQPAAGGGIGHMNRRNFLQSGSIVSVSLAFAKAGRLFSEVTTHDRWRTFQVTTRVEVLKTSGTTRVWVPAALISETPFQKTLTNTFSCEGGTGKLVQNKSDALGIIAAEFPAGVRPILTVTSRIATKDRAVDLSARGAAPKAGRAELEHFLQPTKLLPTDGIVKTTASEITKGAKTDVEKARAIYEWIVDNTFRNPKTRGCGVGDIRF